MSIAPSVAPENSYSPAYVAFTTFRNFIEHLAEHSVPSKIDKSVMSHYSGSTQSHLSSTLKFLGLVTDSQAPAGTLNQLVDAYASDDGWQEVLGSVIKEAYSDVVEDIDILKASSDELDKCFEGQNVSAVMIDRSVRFYLAAMKESGQDYSPHFGRRKPRATRSSNVKKPKQKSAAQQDAKKDDKVHLPPDGMIDYPVYFSGGRQGSIRVPKDLSESDCEMVDLMLPILRAYAANN